MQLGSLFGNKIPGSRSKGLGEKNREKAPYKDAFSGRPEPRALFHPARTSEEPYEIYLGTICTMDKRRKAFVYWPPPSIHQRQPYRCQLPTFPVAHAWVPKRFCPLGRKQEVIHCRPKVRHCQAALQWSKLCNLVTATVAGVSGRATRIGGWTWCTDICI